MKIKHLMTALSTMLAAQSLYAVDYFVYVEGGAGKGMIYDKYAVDNKKLSEEGYVMSVGGGVAFESNFITGLEVAGSKSDSFFGADNRYELEQTKLFGGYRFNIAKHLRITPIVGVDNWRLVTKAGALTYGYKPNVGSYKGTDAFGQINVEFPVGSLVTIISSLNYTEFDFGSLKTAQVGVMFQF